MKEYKELSKGAVKAILADPAGEQGKNHILQINFPKTTTTGESEKKALT